MDLLQHVHRGIDRGATVPIVRHLVEASYRREFIRNRDQNLFYGVFQTFEAAQARAETFGLSGYDNEAAAEMYVHHTRSDAHDYPAMFWLEKSFETGWRKVLDLGGSIGNKFYAFQRAIPLPADIDWTVVDLPAVIARGAEIAASNGVAQALHFAESIVGVKGTQVLFASGSLQYLPQTLGHYLKKWPVRPLRIIINITPVHPVTEFFTVNSIGTAFCPYRVQTQAALVGELCALGYVLRDSWANRGKELVLPTHRELSLDHYRGFCLDLR